jgi:hypothetical protein
VVWLVDHDRVDDSPSFMDAGEALKLLTVQPVPDTVTVTESLFLSVGLSDLAQERVYVVVELGDTDREPEVPTEPIPADIVHPVAPAVAQVREVDPPGLIVVGLALISTVNVEAGGVGQDVPLIVVTPEPWQ